MEKETKGVRTKRQIYQCAMDLFREKGYDQVSVEEIVRTAGTAAGNLFFFFYFFPPDPSFFPPQPL